MKKYIFGLISGLVIIPIIEELMSVVASYIEVLKLHPTKKILKGNQVIQELHSKETVNTNCIGFLADIETKEDDLEGRCEK